MEFSKIFIFYVYNYFACMYVCVCASRSQKRAVYTLELYLQTDVSQYMSTGNQICALYKSSRYS